MIVRADHVAGGVFIAAGIVVLAASGDLPFGSLSFPGSGFMPKIIACLLVLMGALLALGARETPPILEVGWADLRHAVAVLALTAAAVALYTRIGFVLTLPLLLFALLVVVERKRVAPAAIFSVSVTAITYTVFHYILHTPVPVGPLGY